MGKIGDDDAKAALQRGLHHVAVVAAEGALAVYDDQHARVRLAAGILVHVADLPSGAGAVLRGRVFDREGVDHRLLPERLLRIDLRRDAGDAVVLGWHLVSAVGAGDVLHERHEFRIVSMIVNEREDPIMGDRA